MLKEYRAEMKYLRQNKEKAAQVRAAVTSYLVEEM